MDPGKILTPWYSHTPIFLMPWSKDSYILEQNKHADYRNFPAWKTKKHVTWWTYCSYLCHIKKVNLWRYNYFSKDKPHKIFWLPLFVCLSLSGQEVPHLRTSTHLTKMLDMLLQKLKGILSWERKFLNIHWASSHRMKKCPSWDFPGGPVVRNQPYNAGDAGFYPWSGN